MIFNSPFLVLDLGLDVVDGIGRLNLKGDGLAGQSLHKDLHAVYRFISDCFNVDIEGQLHLR